jgi:ABC-type microcin C transport system permease subunit YejE
VLPLSGGRARYVSPATETWRRFRRHRLAVAGLAVLLLMMLAVALGPFVWRAPINDIDFAAQLSGPSWTHPFGTDDLGQDVLARMLYGGRISLAVGLAAMAWPSTRTFASPVWRSWRASTWRSYRVPLTVTDTLCRAGSRVTV